VNMIAWGLNWFQQQRETYTCKTVTIVHSGGTTPGIPASQIEPDTELSREGIRVKSDKTLFIIKTERLEDIRIQMGVKIVTDNGTYEVVRDKGKPHYFNDPEKLDTVIPTKLLCT